MSFKIKFCGECGGVKTVKKITGQIIDPKNWINHKFASGCGCTCK